MQTTPLETRCICPFGHPCCCDEPAPYALTPRAQELLQLHDDAARLLSTCAPSTARVVATFGALCPWWFADDFGVRGIPGDCAHDSLIWCRDAIGLYARGSRFAPSSTLCADRLRRRAELLRLARYLRGTSTRTGSVAADRLDDERVTLRDCEVRS